MATAKVTRVTVGLRKFPVQDLTFGQFATDER